MVRGESGVGWEFHGVEGDGEVSDEPMAEPFDAGVVESDVVGALRARKVAGGEFADEVGERFVGWVWAGFVAQHVEAVALVHCRRCGATIAHLPLGGHTPPSEAPPGRMRGRTYRRPAVPTRLFPNRALDRHATGLNPSGDRLIR